VLPRYHLNKRRAWETGHIKVEFFSAIPHNGDTATSLSKQFQDNLLTDHMKNEAFMQKWKMKACF